MRRQPTQDKYSAPAAPPALPKSHRRLALISLAVIALLPVMSLAQQATLTDDAYTSNKPSRVNRNFGADENLLLAAETPRAFLKFKLTPNLPAGTAGSFVGKATLKLFVGNVSVPGTLEVHAVLATWSEATITDSTAPPLGPVIGTASIQTTDAGKWMTVDLTSLVQQWLGTNGLGSGGIPNNGIALVAAGGADATLDSKENRQTSHEPRLEVVLNHAATADQATTADTANAIAGALPTNKGGTGLSAPGAAGNVLRSNGANWTSAPLVASDFPGLANSFIQNQNTATPQAANFNVSGSGTVGQTLSGNVVNAATQFNLGGNRILSTAGFQNTFVGLNTGASNTAGCCNAFFGFNAGRLNNANDNTFIGNNAGQANTTGARNSLSSPTARFKPRQQQAASPEWLRERDWPAVAPAATLRSR
jgi:hypothetical protein